MSILPINFSATLARIRSRAVTLAAGGWQELGEITNYLLPNPLDPLALLPIATGRAAAGELSVLISTAAAVILFEVALRIVDDCADQDTADALDHVLGFGRAINVAIALNAVATRELSRQPKSNHNVNEVLDTYFQSFLRVCQGQDRDLLRPAADLKEYETIVSLKTVSAYAFATGITAQQVSRDPQVIALCIQCGQHLGWMTQILDDVEALWFPVLENVRELQKGTFPLLFGMEMQHPIAQKLKEIYQGDNTRIQICQLLDEMDVRHHLMHLALDHRDAALEKLNDVSLNPEGRQILQIWLDWWLQGADRLLQSL
jgi:geranylgeranyl pyrophosphate synthase